MAPLVVFLTLAAAVVSFWSSWAVFVPLGLWLIPVAIMAGTGFFTRAGKAAEERLLRKYLIFFTNPRLSVSLAWATRLTLFLCPVFLASAGYHSSQAAGIASLALGLTVYSLADYLNPLLHLERNAKRQLSRGHLRNLRSVLNEALAITEVLKQESPEAYREMQIEEQAGQYRAILTQPQGRVVKVNC